MMNKLKYVILTLGLALLMLTNVSAKSSMMNSSSSASASVNINNEESSAMAEPSASPDNQNVECTIANNQGFLFITAPNNGIFCSGVAADTITANFFSFNDTLASYLWSTGATTQSIFPTSTNTYIVTITDIHGCTKTATQSVTVNPSPAPPVIDSLAPSTCDMKIFSATTFSTYRWSTNPVQTTDTVNVPNGTYTLTVTSAQGCTASSTVHVVIAGAPTASITAGGPTTFCTGGSVVLTAHGGPTYHWSQGNATTAAITVTTSNTYTVTVTVGGCTSTANIVVTVNTPPTVTITPNGAVTICAGDSAALTASFNPGGTYHWSTGATTRPIEVHLAGTYTVTVTNAAGCTGTANKVVTVSALPVPVIDSTTATCWKTLSLSVVYPHYAWSTGATTATINATSGTYTVTVTNAAGCTASATHTVVIANQSAPVIVISGNGHDSLCAGTNRVLSLSATFTAYHWSTNANTATITVNASGNYTVTVTRTGGCTATATQQIVVEPALVPTIRTIPAFGVICSGNVNQLYVRAPAAGNPHYTAYHWTGNLTTDTITFTTTGTYNVTVTNDLGCTGTATVNETVNASPATPVIDSIAATACTKKLYSHTTYNTYRWSTNANTDTITAPASGIYTLTVTNAAGCTASASHTVVVTPAPSPTLTVNGPLTFCAGTDSVTLTVSSAFNSYIWSTGATSQGITVSHENVSPTTYTVTVTNAQGCTGTASLPVTINGGALPVITQTPANICQGQNATLNPGNGFATYHWSTGASTQTIVEGVAGTYTITTTSGAGCSHTASYTLVVNPTPTPVIVSNGPDTFCTGGSVILSTQTTYSLYHWNPGNHTTATVTVTASGTYTLTVTTVAGCTGTATSHPIVVTANITPTITPAGNTTICSGASVTLSTQNYQTYNWIPGGSTTQSITITPTTTTVYQLTASNGVGCSATATKTVTVVPQATANITSSGPTSFCTGGNDTLTVTANTSYHWSTNATTQRLVVSPSVTTTYTVTVTNAGGCTATATQVISVGGNLTVNITGGPTTFCQGGSVNLDAGVFNSYLWSNGATTEVINATTAGTYTVTATQSLGCSGTASTVVTVNPNPTPTITGGPTTLCSGSPATLDAGSGYSNYTWSNTSTTEIVTASPTTNTTYTVTVSDGNGCTGTTSQAITVNPSPSPIIIATGPTNFCNGDSVSLISQSFPSYSWSNGATVQTITVHTTGNYIVTVTAANSCTGTASQQVTVSSSLNPVITSNGPTTFCNPGSVTLYLPGFATYIWSTGSTVDSITTTTGGTYSVTVTSGGCSATASQLVVANNITAPIITANGPTSFCNGDSVTLSVNGYVSYMWSNSATTAAITVNSAANYGITVTDINGCIGTNSQNVVVNTNPSPTITAQGPTTFCEGGSVTLDAGSYSSYSWSNSSSTETTSATTSANYMVTVTDINGCTGTASESVSVNPLPTPVISANGPTSFCPGGSVGLDAGVYPFYSWSNSSTSETVTANTNGNYTVTVTDVNGCASATSIAITVFATPVVTITPSGPTTFCSGDSISLDAGTWATYLWTSTATDESIYASSTGNYGVTITDGNGCVGSTSTAVTVNPTPTPTIPSTSADTFCTGGSVVLNPGTYTSYNWSTSATTQTITANTSNTFTVTVTNANGCSGTASVSVVANNSPVVTITSSGSDTICSGFSISLDAGTYITYSWNNASTSESITVSTASTYTVTVTDFNGCTGTATQAVVVNSLPSVSWNFSVDTTCINYPAITLTGGSPSGGSYLGQAVSGTTFTPNQTTTGNDTLTYRYTDPTTGCVNTAYHVIYVDACTGIPEVSSSYFVSVYPNPNDGNFTISYNVASQITALRIADMTGRIVYSQSLSGLEGKQTINASNLSRGIYYWEVISNSDISSKGKIIIVK